MHSNEITVIKNLAEKGKEFDKDIKARQAKLLQIFSDADYFSVAIANALTWTGHAKDNDEFFKFAIDFLFTGTDSSLIKLKPFCGRLGDEKLVDALRSWKKIILHNKISNNNTCLEIYTLQEKYLKRAIKLKKTEEIKGIGAWLFCAPFKIILAYRTDLWQSQDLDKIWMPLGLEVIRGIKKLIKNGFSLVKDLDPNILKEEEGGLEEGMATVYIIQKKCEEIAKCVDSNILHINSGLYKYGGQKKI